MSDRLVVSSKSERAAPDYLGAATEGQAILKSRGQAHANPRSKKATGLRQSPFCPESRLV